VKGYAVASNNPRDPGFTSIGSIELRILDFRTTTTDTSVDELLKQR